MSFKSLKTVCFGRIALAASALCAAFAPSPSLADDEEEATPDEYAEITYTSAEVPQEVLDRATDGLIPLDAVSYIQSGLVGHFDAIRNVALDQPQDVTATEWKNLVSGYPDAEFISTAGHWRKGYSFCFTGEGFSGCARLKSKLNTGSDIMVQLAVTVDYTKQKYGNSNYPIFFHDGPNELSLFFDNRSAQTRKLYLKADKFISASGNNNRPAVDTWDGRYATFIIHTNQQLIAESATSVKTRAEADDRRIKSFDCQFSWFSAYSKTAETGEAIGDCHAVRIYTAELTPEEIAWNRMLDEVRYRGADTNANVAVWSDAAGVEGAEANGKYMVNGRHVFTAPASVSTNGCTYALAGYTLEVWDSATGAWGAAETHEGESSFDYTNCLARAKVRLTWNWNMTSGAKALDADAYAQRGLVHNFDGIRNAGFGVGHSTNETVWADLGSCGAGGFAEKRTLPSTYWHAKSAAGSWDADGYRFRSRDYFAMTNKTDLGVESTAQVVADYDFAAAKPFASSSGIRWPAFVGALDGGNAFNMYVNVNDNSLVNNVYSYTHGNSSYRPNTTDWDGRFINRTYDATTANKITLTTSYGVDWKSGSKSLPSGSSAGRYTLSIGTDGTADSGSGRQAHIMQGKICAVRFYDRVLTSDELARNRAIDEARFFGRLADLDAMDAVLVRSESPDGKVRLDDEGAYIIRNASKSFTAPATIVSGSKTYTCTGYRIETWNATTRQWNTDTTGTALTVELTSTASGAANRRLTWLWSLSAGLREASDYTAFDYVQDGLMGNFDGIRNHGADHVHNTYTRTWKNLVADQPDAIFNTTYGTWADDAFNFTGNVHASVQSPGINVGGSNLSIQLATVVDWTVQPFGSGYYSIFFGNNNNNDTDIFFNNTSSVTNNNTLRFNADELGTKNNRPTLTWEGQYATAILGDRVSYLVQGTTLTGGKTRTNTTIPARNFTWGGQTSSAKGYSKGKFHSVRIYNRALTAAELAHNRRVDEIRFRGAGDVTVVNGAVGNTGANGESSVADGVYNLDAGTWTFTAQEVSGDGHTYRPRLLVETYDATTGEWTRTSRQWTDSYTYDKSALGDTRIRLTWTWKIRNGMTIVVK